MLPTTGDELQADFELQAQPGLTFNLDLSAGRIAGLTDGLEAVRQAIYLILHTERYEYPIYSWNYGIELLDLYGQPTSYVLPELKRRITEALLEDERVQAVEDFTFEANRSKISASFTVRTIYGDIETGTVVNI